MSTHADRFSAAQAQYRTAVGHDPHRIWMAVLFLLTATEPLWDAYKGRLAYTAPTPTLPDITRLTLDEGLLVSVARNLAASDFATTAAPSVDLAACCTHMDDRTFEVVVAACRMLRGDMGAATHLLDP